MFRMRSFAVWGSDGRGCACARSGMWERWLMRRMFWLLSARGSWCGNPFRGDLYSRDVVKSVFVCYVVFIVGWDDYPGWLVLGCL